MSPSANEDRSLNEDRNVTEDPNMNEDPSIHGEPLCASTPHVRATRALANGHDARDRNCNRVNGNINVHVVSESTTSMDVLSGGESDAGDTLKRQNNNNSISSTLTSIIREGGGGTEVRRRRGADVTYFVAKELLMTERTYKRDLELVTVTWSSRVSSLAASPGGDVPALARACLALGPLALPAGALLARLERALACVPHDNEEPEYKKTPELLYDHLSSTFDEYVRYICNAGALVALVESVRRGNPAVERACAAFDGSAPLPLACLLLRPLHRLLHLHRLAAELCASSGCEAAVRALELAEKAAAAARDQLRHVENHIALCQLQRDIRGYDKLLVAEREFVRMGCLYKHSTRGLQQRMLFLLSDIMVIAMRAGGGGQFRAARVVCLRPLQLSASHLPHSFQLQGEDVDLLFSTSNEQEFIGWYQSLESTIAAARNKDTAVDTELTPYEMEIESPVEACVNAGGALGGVCWHRVTSLHREHLHGALRTQLSGHLLRKFKKSPGWQKLWVVFAAFTLYFYKSWQDDTPLASLPLLGYGVGPPTEGDGIDKDLVFKLQFKNHVYFFRADSLFTYNRWTEVLQTAMVHDHN